MAGGRQLLRVEIFGDGTAKWRELIDLQHLTLCRQFGLDEHRVYFDIASSARAEGSGQSGAGGSTRGARVRDGFVMCAVRREPIGKITFAFEGERFRDVDPTDRREQHRLGGG